LSFGDLRQDGSGHRQHVRDQLREQLERIQLAEDVGLGFYGIGEHHLPEYAVSHPGSVLAAAAAVTDRITLSSAVTVLSTEDPVRLYQEFATIDQLTSGRAEIIAGRGSFTESFPLFGADLGDYDALYAEKLGLLLQIDRQNPLAGRASIARRSRTRSSGRDHSAIISRCLSVPAATRHRRFERGVSVSQSCTPSSVVNPSDLRPW
jgi:alkanesulfonate monooxygenase SsuD/methylene tetrahydromethanopterin reductase-like flavin-dependent oxidoreductase (luciferase family)